MYRKRNIENDFLLTVKFDYRKHWNDLLRYDKDRFSKLTDLYGKALIGKWNELRELRFEQIENAKKYTALTGKFHDLARGNKDRFREMVGAKKGKYIAEIYNFSFTANEHTNSKTLSESS